MPDVSLKPQEIPTNQFEIKKDFYLETKSAVNYEFSLREDGLYVVAVRASAKPGWQNKWWLNFKRVLEDYFDLHLDDDDLRIEIDGRRFTKPDGKKGLFNSPAAISGTKTLGKTKTVIFVLRLAAGIHQIKFIPDGSPYLESVSVEKSADEEKVNFAPQATAENENYYSWYTFAVIGISPQSVHIEAQAQSRQNGSDDDDLKIIINGQVQKNTANRHPNSYFCGLSQKGVPATFIKDLETKEEINYLELYADKTPTLGSVQLSFAPPSAKIPQTNIRTYRPGPKGADYNRDGDPDYLKKVYGIYKSGTDPRGKKLWSLLLLFPLALTLSSLLIIGTLLTLHKTPPVKTDDQIALSERDGSGKTLGVTTQPFVGSTIHRAERLDPESRLAFVRHPLYPAVGLSVIDNLDNIKYFLEGSELKEIPPHGEFIGPGQYVDWLEVGDFDDDGMKEIAVEYIVSGTGLFHPFYVYKESGGSFRLLLKRNDGASQAKLIDLNGDGKKEILYAYVIDASGTGPRSWTVWKEIWGWQKGELNLVSHKFPAIYKNLILFYDHLLTDPDPDSWLKAYYPVIGCLRAKAEINVSGTLADIKTCRDI